MFQILRYGDENGAEVAIVHQYLRQDGTLAASGLPDPKRITVDGICYALAIES